MMLLSRFIVGASSGKNWVWAHQQLFMQMLVGCVPESEASRKVADLTERKKISLLRYLMIGWSPLKGN
jgi:hypothetical protein